MTTPFRKLPPLHVLSAFEAVARHRSFSKAAKELCLTHSAVSQRVSQLEEQLGVRLLARSTRAVRLTPAGTCYLESVRHGLSSLAEASDRVGRAGASLLRLSVVPAFASTWLVARLGAFHRLHPAIELEIDASAAIANVGSGECDAAIRWGHGEWTGVEQIKLFADELLAVCSAPYAGAARLRRPADLRRTTLLRHTLQPWKPWFEKARLDWPEPASGPLFNDSALMLQAAADGQGVALGRRILAMRLLQERALVAPFDVSITLGEGFYVVFAPGSLQRPQVAAFVDWIRSAAHEPVSAINRSCQKI